MTTAVRPSQRIAAAVRQSRRSRRTGTLVDVVDSFHPNSYIDPDEGGRWATVCVDHAGVVYHSTLALARHHAPVPDEWCPSCQGRDPDWSW